MSKKNKLIELLNQVITLQDKMITDLYKEIEFYEGQSGLPYQRKLIPKPVYTNEYQLHILKKKISEL